ncbi:hypothetical protein BpHYR1_023206 [Brachionus plicatilis]|uniref:Uncharacterized protein n=1 Tax=Brachionus plicatilis TaxID=10195 RepID=A0A3M7PV51_BRAPC|nr:hypothetical protein BpHYR1_023206 [Brachionus plicatilis]
MLTSSIYVDDEGKLLNLINDFLLNWIYPCCLINFSLVDSKNLKIVKLSSNLKLRRQFCKLMNKHHNELITRCVHTIVFIKLKKI